MRYLLARLFRRGEMLGPPGAAPGSPSQAASAVVKLIGAVVREQGASEELLAVMDRREWRALVALGEGRVNDFGRREYHHLYETFRRELAPANSVDGADRSSLQELAFVPGSSVARMWVARLFDDATGRSAGLVFEFEDMRLLLAEVERERLLDFAREVLRLLEDK